MSNTSLIHAIDALLPQTQCTQCGTQGCLPYATAIVDQNEAINKCPPGGDVTLKAVAQLLNRPIVPLENPATSQKPRQIAVIDENLCIGCTLCIKACPVDAIIGANKAMHAVIAEDCTGCELCLPPCPMDCISLVDSPYQTETWSIESEDRLTRANAAREHFQKRNARLAKTETQRHHGTHKPDPKAALLAVLARKNT